jgi:hypothetical protein
MEGTKEAESKRIALYIRKDVRRIAAFSGHWPPDPGPADEIASDHEYVAIRTELDEHLSLCPGCKEFLYEHRSYAAEMGYPADLGDLPKN